MILYGIRDVRAREMGDDYVCVVLDNDGIATIDDWPKKWLRSFALNVALYLFMSIFHIIGVIGGYNFNFRLLAWCSICVHGPIHMIVLVYTTIVRYN